MLLPMPLSSVRAPPWPLPKPPGAGRLVGGAFLSPSLMPTASFGLTEPGTLTSALRSFMNWMSVSTSCIAGVDVDRQERVLLLLDDLFGGEVLGIVHLLGVARAARWT